MDAVVSGAWTESEAGPPGGAPPDQRTLLVGCMVTEPMSDSALREHSSEVAGAAAAAGDALKEKRYRLLIRRLRQRLVPAVWEAWGRPGASIVRLLRGSARLAAFRSCGRDSCSSDGAEKRRDARVAARIYAEWMMRLSAGLVRAVALHLDAHFHPVGGTVARGEYSRYVPIGGGSADVGIIGVTGHVRNSEPRFSFAMS